MSRESSEGWARIEEAFYYCKNKQYINRRRVAIGVPADAYDIELG